MFKSKLLFFHFSLSCLICGSISCSVTSLSSLMGNVISMYFVIGSGCWMLMFLISHSITSSTTCVVAGGSSSNEK